MARSRLQMSAIHTGNPRRKKTGLETNIISYMICISRGVCRTKCVQAPGLHEYTNMLLWDLGYNGQFFELPIANGSRYSEFLFLLTTVWRPRGGFNYSR